MASKSPSPPRNPSGKQPEDSKLPTEEELKMRCFVCGSPCYKVNQFFQHVVNKDRPLCPKCYVERDTDIPSDIEMASDSSSRSESPDGDPSPSSAPFTSPTQRAHTLDLQSQPRPRRQRLISESSGGQQRTFSLPNVAISAPPGDIPPQSGSSSELTSPDTGLSSFGVLDEDSSRGCSLSSTRVIPPDSSHSDFSSDLSKSEGLSSGGPSRNESPEADDENSL